MSFMEKMLNNYINSEGFRQAMGILDRTTLQLWLLGRGEYNINYVFTHPVTGKKLVLRLNTSSQMKLENQIAYEYKALKVLEASKRTPEAYFVDDSKARLPYGVLVMEYLKGRSLDYERDIYKAAGIFADIHTLSTAGTDFFIKPHNVLGAMLEECAEMAEVYLTSSLGTGEVKKVLYTLLERASKKLESAGKIQPDYRIINTEVNSSNFIINEEPEHCWLIDWEKPILGEAEQDLAHFMAPTTTFWKTDKILSLGEQEEFVRGYRALVKGRMETDKLEEKIRLYLPLNCLRGVTWCAMAWIQYNATDREIKNEDTYRKLKAYLSMDFLNMIMERYFE